MMVLIMSRKRESKRKYIEEKKIKGDVDT